MGSPQCDVWKQRGVSNAYCLYAAFWTAIGVKGGCYRQDLLDGPLCCLSHLVVVAGTESLTA